MPTLRPVANSLRLVQKTRTPFPDPPKVVTIPEQSDPFEPLDYSPLRNPPPTNIGLLSEVAVAAATVGNDDCDISNDDQSKSPPRVAGRKGSLRDDDGEDDESKNPLSIEDSKDPSYRQPEFFEDDELLYSDDNELDASFEEVLDEVARQIEYSDPKKVNHGRRRTKLIAGGPQQPDYAGMNAVEQDMAKAKLYSDKCGRTRLKGNVDLDVLSKGTYSRCLHPTLRPMSDVESNRILVVHTFPDVHVLQLRIAK